jgi:class 3 adenylate cyclase
MTAVAACRTCGTEPLENARFCHGCGSPLAEADTHAEYKQVTVLFADVVHSMNIAAVVGAERLREIMAELVNRAMAVVQRYGATVDQFTGDGIMAVFGAPVALEDHAFRACLAALEIQREVQGMAAEIGQQDGVSLRIRVGLNSGQVIAGEFGSAAIGYTAIGEQVGMAQRMESAAPPGGVMLSDSTAQLVARAAILGDPEMVSIKGAEAPVLARRLLGVASERERTVPAQSTLVGRELEVHTMTGLLDRAISGRGSVVGVLGPPGIGKSRLVREVMEIAKSRGAKVFSTYCESHASQIPFRAVARMFRAAARIDGLDDAGARARLRDQLPDADPDDLLLLDDLLGIADPDATLPRIDPDARRRRLAALINTANLARTDPILYVMEDVHWIDDVSEAMMADVLAVIGQTPAMSVITYRPEYEGALTRVHSAHTLALTPLTDSETCSLIGELLGPDPSNEGLTSPIVSRVAGNPFFAEEMVRELAQRGVLNGERGRYVCQADVADVTVPGTVQATIGARIDRLDPPAKRTLSAASVIGLEFGVDLLTDLGVEPTLDELVRAELIDQVRFTPRARYAFHHPLIRAVAYESQLKSDRSEWHRRLASVIQTSEPAAVEENAALIAEHLEAAGEPNVAGGGHRRSSSQEDPATCIAGKAPAYDFAADGALTRRRDDRLQAGRVLGQCRERLVVLVQAEPVGDEPVGAHTSGSQHRQRPVHAVDLGERTLDGQLSPEDVVRAPGDAILGVAHSVDEDGAVDGDEVRQQCNDARRAGDVDGNVEAVGREVAQGAEGRLGVTRNAYDVVHAIVRGEVELELCWGCDGDTSGASVQEQLGQQQPCRAGADHQDVGARAQPEHIHAVHRAGQRLGEDGHVLGDVIRRIDLVRRADKRLRAPAGGVDTEGAKVRTVQRITLRAQRALTAR